MRKRLMNFAFDFGVWLGDVLEDILYLAMLFPAALAGAVVNVCGYLWYDFIKPGRKEK